MKINPNYFPVALLLANLCIFLVSPAQFFAVASYEGSVKQTATNYFLLLIQLAALTANWGRLKKKHRMWFLSCYLFFWLFQFSLCMFFTECSGVSIVWNAFGVVLARNGCKSKAVWTTVVAADLYYFVLDFQSGDYLTSLAHVLALGLGMVLSYTRPH
eukprot:TRINITY_DN7505_c0_g1_i1.p1 TRINITY_DN7505_c0_g1~~TRINITY_DN7505_c0_g1_i1.p1  ORF type:complete len:158 (-),score=23.42 TRINITY_DN7505_c0_g1_i1:247-720(-)